MNLLSRVIAFVSPVILVTLIACSSSNDDEVCDGQGQCICKESCSKSCDSTTGCQFVCETGTCAFECPNGNCRVSCDGTSNCNVNCAKGGCTVSGGSGKTDVKCGGLGTCTVSCQGSDCLVDGQPAASGSSSPDAGVPEIPGLPGTATGE